MRVWFGGGGGGDGGGGWGRLRGLDWFEGFGGFWERIEEEVIVGLEERERRGGVERGTEGGDGAEGGFGRNVGRGGFGERRRA